MAFPKKVLLTGIAAVALASPALAADRMTDSLKQQYLTGEDMKQRGAAAGDQGAIGATKPNSGPGVQGPAGTRTGPAAKAPEGATSGASSGEAGAAGGAATTQPSQDSSGVQGFPDTRTGPSTHKSNDTE